MICQGYKKFAITLFILMCASCIEDNQKSESMNNECYMKENVESIIVEDDILEKLERMYKDGGLEKIINWADETFKRGDVIIFPPGENARKGIISDREIVKVDKYFKPTNEYFLNPLPEEKSVAEETFSTWVVPYVQEPFAVRVKTCLK